MPLQLLPLPPSEWARYMQICSVAFQPGIMSVMYPNGLSEQASQHAVASMRRLDERNPGLIHCFKVIDPDLPADDPFDRIVGVSHWKIFAKERSEEEMEEEKKASDRDDELYGSPPGQSEEVVEAFGSQTSELREKHLGRQPYVLLHVVATRPDQGRKGVGAISMKWGCDKADELGLPAYLEGSPKGVGLYKRWGFEVVDEMPFDATEYGYDDPLTHLCMKREPQRGGEIGNV